MFGFLWDLHQQNRLRALDLESSRARQDSRSGLQAAEELRAKLDRLELLCAAMGSLLQEHTGITGVQIEERIRELDMQDGRLDGRMPTVAKTCLTCGRAISGDRGWCMYCGISSKG